MLSNICSILNRKNNIIIYLIVGILFLAGKYALVVSKYKMPMLSQLKFRTAEFFSAEKILCDSYVRLFGLENC